MTMTKARICEVDMDDSVYVGNGRDGVYYDAAKGPDGWYTSSVVDSETGSFVDNLIVDDGPYPTAEAACWGGFNGATDWCINNTVRYNRREAERARNRRWQVLFGRELRKA